MPTSHVVITHDIAYGPLPRQMLDIYRPAHTTPTTKLVVFMYGGAWNSGSKAMYPFVAATLARAGIAVVVPDYRVFPEVKYPDFLRDCAQAVAWTQSHRAQTATGDLFLMGHSAGAYNAAMLALDPAWLRAAGADPGAIAGLIGLAGPYDFLPIQDEAIKPIFPDAGLDTQPITYASHAAPPTLLLAGTDDGQVRPRNSIALAGRLKAAGAAVTLIKYPGIGHIGLITAMAPAFQWRAPVFADVVRFIRDTPLPARR